MPPTEQPNETHQTWWREHDSMMVLQKNQNICDCGSGVGVWSSKVEGLGEPEVLAGLLVW